MKYIKVEVAKVCKAHNGYRLGCQDCRQAHEWSLSRVQELVESEGLMTDDARSLAEAEQTVARFSISAGGA